jgi:heme-degrading monooxygenase HmoA
MFSLWESEAEMKASEGMAGKLREQALGTIGGEVTVEEFDQLAGEIGDPPLAEGCYVRMRRISMEPGRVDGNLAVFRSEVLPAMIAAPGFREVRNLIDRATGRGVVLTGWSDESAMDAADAALEPRRQEATGRGVQFGETTPAVVLLSDLRPSATKPLITF